MWEPAPCGTPSAPTGPHSGCLPALAEVADALLVEYYDSMYAYQRSKRPGQQHRVPCDSGDALENARRLLAALDDL